MQVIPKLQTSALPSYALSCNIANPTENINQFFCFQNKKREEKKGALSKPDLNNLGCHPERCSNDSVSLGQRVLQVGRNSKIS
jgi:hypothetical protein